MYASDNTHVGIYPVTYVPTMSYSVPIQVNEVIKSSINYVADCSD